MAFREKISWVSFIATLLVFAAFLALTGQALSEGVREPSGYLALFIGAGIVEGIVLGVLAAILAIASPKAAHAPKDERELMIELKAIRVAYIVLIVCITVLVAAIGTVFPDLLPADVRQGVTLCGVISTFFIAELVREATQIFQFRRGY